MLVMAGLVPPAGPKPASARRRPRHPRLDVIRGEKRRGCPAQGRARRRKTDLSLSMRPTLLNPLFAPVTTLPGVGPKQDKLLRYLLSRDETPRLVDLLLHLPASVIDRRSQPKIREAVQGTMVTLEITVDRHRPPPPRNARAPYLVYASDDTGDVVLTFFRAKPGYVEKLL